MRIWETLHQSDLPSTNWWSPNTVALVVKRLPADVGDLRDAGSIPGSGRCPGGGYCNSLQYSCLEKSMDRGAWRAMVHRVSSSRSRRKRLARIQTQRHQSVSSKTPLLLPSVLNPSLLVLLDPPSPTHLLSAANLA